MSSQPPSPTGPSNCSHCGGPLYAHREWCPAYQTPDEAKASKSGSPIGGVGCLVIVAAALVGLLALGWNIALGFVAPNRGMDDQQVAAMEDLVEGKWLGYYVCDGARRGISVEFDRMLTKRTDVTATLTLHDGGRPGAAPIGAYVLKGDFDGRRLTLVPDSWDERVPGLGMIDFAGTSDGKVISGEVDTPGRYNCADFRLRR